MVSDLFLSISDPISNPSKVTEDVTAEMLGSFMNGVLGLSISNVRFCSWFSLIQNLHLPSLWTPRDYHQDLEALIASKPNKLTVDMLAMYQDHIAKEIQKVALAVQTGLIWPLMLKMRRTGWVEKNSSY